MVVVAHSMGGIAGLQFAELFPEELGSRCRRRAGAGRVHLRRHRRGMTAAVSAWGSAWAQRTLITGAFRFMGQDPGGPTSSAGAAATSATWARLFGWVEPLAQPGRVHRPDAGRHRRRGLGQGLPRLVDFDLSESLEAVSVPALVAVGDKDRCCRPRPGTWPTRSPGRAC